MRIVCFTSAALALRTNHVAAKSTVQRNVQDATGYGEYEGTGRLYVNDQTQDATGYSEYEGTGQFYVNDQTQTCVRDCEPGSSLEVPNRICGGIVRESWVQLFHTVSECCSFKLGWIDPDVCVDKANPTSSGTFKFFADVQNGFCRRDCEPGYAVGCQPRPPPVVLHDTIGDCCSLSLVWVDPKFCDTRSVDTFSNGWVVDWLGERCTKDCDPAHGPPCAHHKEPTEEIFNTPQQCCENFSWIDTNKCVGQSLGTTVFSNQWYVDWTTNTCKLDCAYSLGPPCAGNPRDAATDLYYSAETCCQQRLSWVDQSYCVGSSTGTPPSPTGPSYPNPMPSQDPLAVPSHDPLAAPSQDPLSAGVMCQIDSDCHHVCQGSTVGSPGMCQLDPMSNSVPTTAPISSIDCTCTNPKTVPDKCDLEILIDEMELVFSASRRLYAQSIRAAFHDAGTFDRNNNEGGANGCLLNEPAMRLEGENNGLDLPLNVLQTIKDFWINHPSTCLDVSSADILQFAAFFAVVRQSGVPDTPLNQAKRDILTGDNPAMGNVVFQWGRPDEQVCDTLWTDNLPAFSVGGPSIPARCTAAGGEIKEKMMDRNGFTALEATALIGAHTIGVVRHTFGSSLAGPWVLNGDDGFGKEGPVFDNAYHNFLINTIVANDVNTFASNPIQSCGGAVNPASSIDPFTCDFGTWFRDDPNGLDHLDTDIALAFPTLDATVHPNFHDFTLMFAADNDAFLEIFFLSLDKLSKLGVLTTLEPASTCSACSPSTSTNNRRTLFEVGVGGGGRALQEQEASAVPLDTLNTTGMTFLIKKLGNDTAFADVRLRYVQSTRREEIANLTTPLLPAPAPTTSSPTATSTSSLSPTIDRLIP